MALSKIIENKQLCRCREAARCFVPL